MADQPVNPGVVDWSGENPSMYLDVNGAHEVGKPMPRDMYGTKSTTAFLASSETWVRG
ncbi:MAG TPA: hypothetical protein VLK82_15280 [Candidatus Tectomicrobia bacterium]|nr:hypothetical protein [Candidatus Tectomicrobia bacterium]